ncbi:MAG: hypothetical protein HY746_00155 [Elusimicrobia bacterium]|nr:hypothetical protein [Elusimicrobiota bacterium]
MKNYIDYSANQLIENSSFTYHYDLNGNLTAELALPRKTEYKYNSENQLIEVKISSSVHSPLTTIHYSYDPLCRRISK